MICSGVSPKLFLDSTDTWPGAGPHILVKNIVSVTGATCLLPLTLVSLPGAADEVLHTVTCRVCTLMSTRCGRLCCGTGSCRLRGPISGGILVPFVASQLHGGVLSPDTHPSVNLPTLVPVVHRAPNVVQLDIPDAPIEGTRNLPYDPVYRHGVGAGVRGEVLPLAVLVVHHCALEKGPTQSKAADSPLLILLSPTRTLQEHPRALKQAGSALKNLTFSGLIPLDTVPIFVGKDEVSRALHVVLQQGLTGASSGAVYVPMTVLKNLPGPLSILLTGGVDAAFLVIIFGGMEALSFIQG